MIPMTLAQIAEAVSGRLMPADQGEVVVDGPVVSDSRQAGPGGLYVARVGEFADGHEFAGAAQQAGAVATLGEREIEGMATVVVSDVQDAFAALGRAVVDRAPQLTIVGITGSSGKTSTKDLLGQVLTPVADTVVPEGSLNSEVGVPLTVCRITPQTRFLVAEMGANGVGHIEYLTRIAPPSVGIVLNVGRAHVGEFGSVEAIARTKGELVEALPDDGLAVLNADDPAVRAMASRTRARVQLVGTSEDADLRATDIMLDERSRASFTLVGDGEPRRITLGLFGTHHVGNALAVYAAARHVGVDADHIVSALESAAAVSRWRMEVFELRNGVTLVNDAYNANPDSMAAALRALSTMKTDGRRVAVLGQMLEMGEASAQEHAAVGAKVAEYGIDRLVTVGQGADLIGVAAREQGVAWEHTADVDAAYGLLTATLQSGDLALLKSSRDSGLRYLGDRIVEADGETPA
ncbi:UDP-N-acetylmuramoyl-tripeptide--D-alanyl-D-alanine ligase [Yimella sp. cx-51]|uniref:UDP-N-acetylmuramoyl-tripeptide--D-alanyl-D- alanine ligase n=1 Tax=Yimella sp. cx-51 TaxID=2770551 RepID=UPI00165EB8F6|nr:UDP-N-acetylmuramoyl-tripeptide--D-alanyl-D-alanine ligase [Yimella sp. cx-51]MBC9957268.1 UDP-N-acetylmuramoyl-tripeptide--D-alanyl-D-alanine ligase [Yimella sp. cx-51]QTH37093.1 UDP-N-acetylmuramoyl-tripeptide--D-alanyl-D-alanine ligase [Yimella sp. cx-51]